MFQSGLQNCCRTCSCTKKRSRSSSARQSTHGQSSFDCNSVFGPPKGGGDSSNAKCCEVCPIRQMCKDILMDIKRFRSSRCESREKQNSCRDSGKKQKSRRCPRQSSPLQDQTCGQQQQTWPVETKPNSLCEDLTELLKYFGISPVETKPREKPPEFRGCNYYCDYHQQDLPSASSVDLCMEGARRKGDGDFDSARKRDKDVEEKRKKRRGSDNDSDTRRKKGGGDNDSSSTNDFDNGKSGKRDRMSKKDKDGDETERKNKFDTDKSRKKAGGTKGDKSKQSKKNRKDRRSKDDGDDDDRGKDSRMGGGFDGKQVQNKPPRESITNAESDERRKAGEQKSPQPDSDKTKKSDLDGTKAGKTSTSNYLKRRREKDCMNQAIGKRITEQMRFHLEQLDLKRMNQQQKQQTCPAEKDQCRVCVPCVPCLPQCCPMPCVPCTV